MKKYILRLILFFLVMGLQVGCEFKNELISEIGLVRDKKHQHKWAGGLAKWRVLAHLCSDQPTGSYPANDTQAEERLFHRCDRGPTWHRIDAGAWRAA